MAFVPSNLVHQHPPVKSITDIIREGTEVEAALDRGFYRAVLRHRAGNVPMVFWRDGKIVEVDANEIEIPEEILTQIRNSDS